MFLKMLKHESRATARSMLPLVAGLLVMAILARGAIWLKQNVASQASNNAIGTTLLGLFLIAFFLGCIAIVVATTILMMGRFAKSVYSDAGYLTNTLPVNTSTILLCHLLLSFLGIVISFVTVYVGFWIVTAGSKIGSFFNSIGSAFGERGIDKTSALFQLLATGVMSILNTILMFFAGISIGHSFSGGKTGKSVLFVFILYFVQQMISSLLMVAVMLISTGGLKSYSSNLEFSTAVWFSMIQYLFFGSVYYFLTWFMTKKHLNLS